MMWPSYEYFQTTKAIKEREVLEHVRARMALERLGQATEDHRPRAWQWRVERAMEEVSTISSTGSFPCAMQRKERKQRGPSPQALPRCRLPRCCC